MRVEAPILVLLASVALLWLGPAQAQDAQDKSDDLPSALAVAKAEERLQFVKLLAQNAARPRLVGDDKFILRESWWSGSLEPGKAKLIQVQLFRRNNYQFWFAVPSEAAGLNLNIYDSEGQIIPTETMESDRENIASVVVSPEVTGVYYVRISLKTTTPEPQDWAVIYAYN